jgi:hypothetical protein
MAFEEFVKSYGKGAALLFASAAVSYFLTFHSTLSPPLKPREAVYGMSVLVEAYGILVGLNSTSSRRPPLNLMIGSILVYLVFLFALTFLVPTTDQHATGLNQKSWRKRLLNQTGFGNFGQLSLFEACYVRFGSWLFGPLL